MSRTPPTPPEWLTLEDGERVWLIASPSRNLLLAALATGFVLLIAMSLLVSAMDDLGTGRAISLTVLLVIVGLLLGAYALTRRSEYVLTSERASAAVGLRSKRIESVDLEDVRDVTIEQSGWQQLVNVGTLRFTADGDALAFSLIGEPSVAYQRALELLEGES